MEMHKEEFEIFESSSLLTPATSITTAPVLACSPLPPPPPPPPPPPQPPSPTVIAKKSNPKSLNLPPYLGNSHRPPKLNANLKRIITEMDESTQLRHNRPHVLKQANEVYNQSYPEVDNTLIGRTVRVRFANADTAAEVSIDKWFEHEVIITDNDSDEFFTQLSTSSDFNDCEEDEYAKTHYLCRSKGGETTTPINLQFPAKTTVVIVDRRNTSNGSRDLVCSLAGSK